jgi:hypothetical protein
MTANRGRAAVPADNSRRESLMIDNQAAGLHAGRAPRSVSAGINLKAAKAPAYQVLAGVVLRADEVIE